MFQMNTDMPKFLLTFKDGKAPVRNPADCKLRDDAEEHGLIRIVSGVKEEEMIRRPNGGVSFIGDSKFIWGELTDEGKEYLEAWAE